MRAAVRQTICRRTTEALNAMGWHANLSLQYAVEAGRCVARFSHNGPLRVLKTLYPEGDQVCHNVLVHPPGGLVGGDTLDIQVRVNSGAHALVTTPGAARFYRSDGEPALQRTVLHLESGARLEWLPLEAILYTGCKAENMLTAELADGAQMIGWDVTSLGLPGADLPFLKGSFLQHLELTGQWLERGRIAADDHLLLTSPLGLSGQTCMATLFFASGNALERKQKESLLDAARLCMDAHPLKGHAGITSAGPRVVVLRVLAAGVEPAMGLLRQVWLAWRGLAWGRPAVMPRIWAT